MRKFIIDTDPGIDDAVAILTAFNCADWEILGITPVAGNIPQPRCVENALGLVAFAGKNIPVYAGEVEPITYNETLLNNRADDVHGKVGLGGVLLDKKNRVIEAQSAVDFIIETVAANPNEIEIIAIGPLTNLARAIEKAPETMKQVKTIWIMGGGVNRGNVTPYAEFNFWADAKAADMVFGLGEFLPIYMYGLNVTHKSPILPEDLLYVGAFGGTTGKLMLDMCLHYVRAYFSNLGKMNTVMHDLLTVIGADMPEVCEYAHCHVHVVHDGERIGESVCDIDKTTPNKPNAYVAVTVDTEKYKQRFVEIAFPEAAIGYSKLTEVRRGK